MWRWKMVTESKNHNLGNVKVVRESNHQQRNENMKDGFWIQTSSGKWGDNEGIQTSTAKCEEVTESKHNQGNMKMARESNHKRRNKMWKCNRTPTTAGICGDGKESYYIHPRKRSVYDKLLGSFRYRKSPNFLGLPVCKLQIRKFLWLIRKRKSAN